ncbi:MAG: hypothetical protein V3T17_11730 [Pseudomonadales bacterium]
MGKTQNISSEIQQLLLKNTVMSLKQLRTELNGRPRSSLFRDFKKVDLISSYTHTGQYHALNKAAKFDDNGLWIFHNIGFSQYGSLKKTLPHLIDNSPTGMTHKELKKLCRVEIQKPITDLVNTHTVTRQLLPSRIYVYLSTDANKAEDQFQQRLTLSDQALNITLPPESIRIEILVEVIQAPNRTLDEQVLGSLLRKRGISVTNDEINYVLVYYNIKKKQILK